MCVCAQGVDEIITDYEWGLKLKEPIREEIKTIDHMDAPRDKQSGNV